jgi:hypothetical protein
MSGARPDRRPAAVLTVLGLCAALAGALLLPGRPVGPPDTGALPAGGPAAAPRAVPVSPPDRLTLPGAHPAARRVVPVAADGAGALRLPPEPDTLGWWALGARPGETRGTVLLAGHLDTAGGAPGAFAALRDVRLPGRVEIRTADGRRHAYTLTARRTYDNASLPRDLFTADGPHRLALVTCAGRYDRAERRYERNLVLYGRPGRA